MHLPNTTKKKKLDMNWSVLHRSIYMTLKQATVAVQRSTVGTSEGRRETVTRR